MERIGEVVFGETRATQQRLGGDVAFVESRNRALGGKPCYCWRPMDRALLQGSGLQVVSPVMVLPQL